MIVYVETIEGEGISKSVYSTYTVSGKITSSEIFMTIIFFSVCNYTFYTFYPQVFKIL